MRKTITLFLKFIFIAFLLFFLAKPFYFKYLYYSKHNSENVGITVYPPNGQIEAYRLSVDGIIEPIQRVDKSLWEDTGLSINGIMLLFPREHLGSLEIIQVKIGSDQFNFNRDEFIKNWIKMENARISYGFDLYSSPNFVSSKRSSLSRFSTIINWAGDSNLFGKTVIGGPFIFIIIFLFYLIFLFLLKTRFWVLFKKYFENKSYIFTDVKSTEKEYSKYKISTAAGLLFLLGCIFYLEYSETFYFIQDDNLVQFMPAIIQGCRSFFEEGVFPTLNPYQIMGSPNSNLGIYALTYPFTYLSYFIAKTIFDNEYLTIDIFAVIHIILGYFAALWLCKLGRIRPFTAVVASLSFILSGYNLIIGRSWYYMLPVMLWAPLQAVSVMKFKKGEITLAWILFTGLTIGLFFHAGNSQMWFYSLTFFFLSLAVVLTTQKVPLIKTLYIIPAVCLGLSIALILLVPTYIATADIPRSISIGSEGILRGVMAMFLPYPLAKGPHPIDQVYWYSNYSGLYYNGSLFNIISALSIAGLIAGLVYYRKDCGYFRKLINDNIWLLMAFVAFLFALGNSGFLWELFSNIPPFNRFKLPFKFLPFVNLFASVGGAVIFERYLVHKKINIYAQTAIYIVVLCLLFYNLTLCKTALYMYGDKPYPKLPQNVYKLLTAENKERPQRIYVSAPLHSPDKGFLLSLQHDIPTIYRIPSIVGYEVLAPRPILGNDEFYQYGVKYVLGLNASTDLHGGGTPFPPPAYFDLKKITEFNKVELYELKNALPLAFLTHNKFSLPVKFTGRGAVIDVSIVKQPADVTANIFYRKGMSAKAEGKKLTIRPDEWNRALVLNCPPTKKLEIIYNPFWDKGFIMSGIFLLLSAASWQIVRHLEGRKKT